LVTCSKDKTIKVFNRRPMNPGDLGYPHLPGAVYPVPTFLNNYGLDPTPSAGLPTKPPYSMIGCLEGHGAAVNAVQIYGHEVVSASGDRTVKIWNWPEQTCTRTLLGHSKGIACVQYDGRRIVSGSSDNEVKVFDRESGLEVASLRTHTNLVRTVQAGFGDLPYSQDEDKENAKNIDDDYFRAIDAGTISQTMPLQRGRGKNAGSRKPEDITAYGATLPPGGGGGKFGRIVSGSYDETIIIWKRDKEGVWRALHTLRQEEAARVASRAERQRSSLSTTIHNSSLATQHLGPSSAIAVAVDAASAAHPRGTDHWYRMLIDLSVSQGPAALREALLHHPRMLVHHQRLRQAIFGLPAGNQQALVSEVLAAFNARQQSFAGTPGPPFPSLAAFTAAWVSQAPPMLTTTTPLPSSALPPSQITPSHQVTQAPLVSTPIQTPSASTQTLVTNLPPLILQAPAPAAPQPAPIPNHHHHHQPAYNHQPHNMARVFKLQFDARRVICCSQTSIIVGWDFANGDEQIIEASRFFAPIE